MSTQTRLAKFFDGFSYILLLLNILIVPLFLDKNLSNFYIIPKQYVFGGLIIINLFVWMLKLIFTKKLQFTFTMLDKPIVAVVIAGLFSAIFSTNIFSAFFGRAEFFSFNFALLILFICFYYCLVNFVTTEKRWRGVLDAVSFAGLLSFIFFILKIFFKFDFLTNFFGSAVNTVDNVNSLFGVWTIFILILSFGQLIKKTIGLARNIFYFVVGLFSLSIIVMLSFTILWWILLVSLALLLVLGISFVKEVRLGWLSALFAMLVFTIIFIIFGTPKFLQIPVPSEVSLGFKPSFSVTSATLFSGVKNFFIGSGFGSFGVDFSKFRSVEFNADPVAWSMRFSQPASTLFSLVSEGGLVLICSIIFLVLLLLGHIFQMWNKMRVEALNPSAEINFTKDNVLFESFLLTNAFMVLTLGFGVMFYSQVLWWVWWMTLALIVVGFSFYNRHFIKEKIWTLEESPQYNLSFSFSLIMIVIGLIMLGVWGARLYLGERSFAKAQSSGSYDKAEVYINDALSKQPNSDVYHAALAQIYLNQAVEMSKQSTPDVQAISAVMAKAVNEAKFATDISPQSVVLWDNLATMYENAAALVPEARDWAIKTLVQARDLEPTNPVYWWRLGNNFTATSKWDEAIKNYEKAVELKKDYFGAYSGLSNAYEQTQKIDKAIEVYEKIIPQTQVSPEVLYNYGRLLYNRDGRGDKAMAEKIWNKVVELQPNYSNALYSLGLLYESRGDMSTALQFYYKVKDLNPNNKSIIEKIKKLVGASNPVAPSISPTGKTN